MVPASGQHAHAVDIEEALRRCGGAARWAQLRASGVTRFALRTALAVERVNAAGHGTYALPGTDAAIVAAVTLSGVVSHASAARLHGLDLHSAPKFIEITVARGCRQRARGVLVHAADLAPEDVGLAQPITTLRRTVRDCARTMPLLHAVILLDGVVRAGLLSMADLRAMARTARGRGSARLRQAVGYVDALCGSPLETILRLLSEILFLDVQTQVWIEGVGPVDILVDGWLILEADGFAFHSNREHYRRDRRRANVAAEQLLVHLRFTWEDLQLRPLAVLGQIVRTVEAQRPGSCNSQLVSEFQTAKSPHP